MAAKLYYKDMDLANKRVLIRVDFNVPLKPDLTVDNNARIVAVLPTLRHILTVPGTKIILMSHLGRPDGRVLPEFSLKPAADELRRLLGNVTVKMAPAVLDQDALVNSLQPHEILVLENVRFHAEEERNDAEFARKLAAYGDVYLNDAFGTAHRAHASTEGIAKYFPGKAGSGELMGMEVRYLHGACTAPQRPFVGILGGAKISEKINVVKNLLTKVDKLIIGGGMAYTFLRAKGIEIGRSLLMADKLLYCAEMLAKNGDKIVLPVDAVCVDKMNFKARTVGRMEVHPVDQIPANMEAVDIGPRTVELFTNVIRSARTVVWNGPMGVFEIDQLAAGTNAVARALADLTAAGGITVVGGGDSASAVEKSGVKVSHVSTGGGASLEYLEGKPLPGLMALTDAAPAAH